MSFGKIALILAGLAFFILVYIYFSGTKTQPISETNPVTATPTLSPTQKPVEDATISPMPTDSKDNKLVIEDIKVGSGEEALVGKKITVNYRGELVNGTEFDSSYERGIPFDFTLGAGDVIEGWDQGLVGMKVDGKRKLTIPPALGYGQNAIGSIPANSTLVFEIELLKVE